MRFHKKLALRALAGSASSPIGHPTSSSPAPALNSSDGGSLGMVPANGSTATWTSPILSARQAPSYHLSDVEQCTLPSLSDVPILYIPVDVRGMALDRPTPEMWHALNMNLWIKKLFDDCPAVRSAKCNDKGGGNEEYCGFTTSLSVLLMGSVYTHEDAVDYAGFPCGLDSCGWETSVNASRGPISGSTIRKTIGPRAGELEIMEYRRWYTMVAVKDIWRYHRGLQEMLKTSIITQGLQLQELVDTFAPVELKSAPSTSVFEILNVIRTITSFLPFGNEVGKVLDVLDVLVDGATGNREKFWGQDVVAVAQSISGQVQKTHEQLGQYMTAVIASTAHYRDNFGTEIPESEDVGAQLPNVTLAGLQSTLANLFTEMSGAIANQTTAAVDGDPMAPGGFYYLASTGLFSSWQETDNWSTMNAKAIEYSKFIREKIVLNIFESMKVWLYRQTFSQSRVGECRREEFFQSGLLCVPVPGDVQGRSYRYLAFVYSNTKKNTDGGIDIANRYPQLNPENLKKVFGDDLTLEKLYTKSSDCFTATQQAFLDSDGTTCHGVWDGPAKNFSPVKAWPEALEDYKTVLKGKPRDLVCHYNIPVLDSELPNVKKGCLDDWYLNRIPTSYWLQGAHYWTGFESGTKTYCAHVNEVWQPAQALSYGRSLFYPSHEQCNGGGTVSEYDRGAYLYRAYRGPNDSYYDGYR